MHNAYVSLKSYVLDLLKYEHNSKFFTQICKRNRKINYRMRIWLFDPRRRQHKRFIVLYDAKKMRETRRN